MVHVINARNVNDALHHGIEHLLNEGVKEDTRNGPCLVSPGPVVTVYANPLERVLFSPARAANPFFHLMEALWMLGGRIDIKWPAYFNSKFLAYSDDGINQHGAYGFRWRNWWRFDQLSEIVRELDTNPNSRRAVLTMWSPLGDLVGIPMKREGIDGVVGGPGSKDVPCNTHAYFDLRNGVLNMTVCCRSNDIIWGAYGANVVHFSMLQEYVAGRLGCAVGEYRQFSNNYHLYTDTYTIEQLEQMHHESVQHDHYMDGSVRPVALMQEGGIPWDKAVQVFLENPTERFPDYPPFFNQVAVPMFKAWEERKAKVGNGFHFIEEMPACDWKIAVMQWISQRERKH